MSKSLEFYITGTDTDAGKTLVSAAILRACALQGKKSIGMKSAASGCEWVDGKDGAGKVLRNSDALNLQRHASETLPYELINPLSFEPAIAPHIAAQEAGIDLNVADLLAYSQKFREQDADLRLFEGAGGWFVPLNDKETLEDYAVGLGCPVILVVAIRLGCINHALLSAKAIQDSGLKLAGWVANHVMDDPDQDRRYVENVATIENMIGVPCLASIPYMNHADEDERIKKAAEYINPDLLGF